MTIKAIYPGTFDPITNGHLDLVKRASLMFDHLVLAIAANSNKNTLFNLEERLYLATQVTSQIYNVEVLCFDGLITHFATYHNVNIMVRGLRTISDFEHESQMANINRYLMPTLEIVFLMAANAWSCISSSMVKEVACYGGDMTPFLPTVVTKALMSKFDIQE